MAKKRLAAWERLRQAIDRACIARGEAKWTNGYRAGLSASGRAGEADALFDKQMRQFKHCAAVEKRMERQIAAFARAVRAERRK